MQLSKRPVAHGRGSTLYPPPAPPPPPPPLELMPHRHLDSTSDSDTLFTSARAALKAIVLPTEAPINPAISNRTKRQGQPTVNVPSDKMAAFLNEIKTVKLRRVGAEGSLSRLSRSASSGGLARNASASASGLPRGSVNGPSVTKCGSTSSREQEAQEQGIRIGEKRKRYENCGTDVQHALRMFTHFYISVPTLKSIGFVQQ